MAAPPDADGTRFDIDASLVTLRVIVVALTAGVLVLAGIGMALPRFGAGVPSAVVLAAALAGLVAPIVGYRLYHRLLAPNADGPASAAERRAALHRATIVSLAVSEGAAMAGVVVYLLSAEPLALVGAVTHVLLAGAVWPSRARFEHVVGGPEAG